MPSALAKAVSIIYERMNHLDIECLYNFTEWFSHHLSNFDYNWLWGQWTNPPTSVQDEFVKNLLSNCIRLSYFERIEGAIPPDLYNKLPIKPKPNFKFDDDKNKGHVYAQELLKRMKGKEGSDNIILWIESESNPMSQLNDQDTVEIIASCILHLGSKSFTHLTSTIERYIGLTQKYIINMEGEVYTINSILEYWEFSPQNIIICCSKFLDYHIITYRGLVEMILRNLIQKNMKQFFPWSLLFTTINKSILNKDLIQKQFKSLENPTHKHNPTNEEIKNYSEQEEKLEKIKGEQKELFLLLWTEFDLLLKQYYSSDGEKYDDRWLPIILGNLKAVGRKYYKYMTPILENFDISLVDANESVIEIYEQIKSLSLNYD